MTNKSHRFPALLVALTLMLVPLTAEAANPIDSFLTSISKAVRNILNRRPTVPKVITVQQTVTTMPNSTTPLSFDGSASLPFDKMKRYTVSVSPGQLLGAPRGIDRVRVFNGVLKRPLATVVVTVLDVDPAGPLDSRYLLGPYTGSNSYMSVQRGADGLGPVDVSVNVFIEIEP